MLLLSMGLTLNCLFIYKTIIPIEDEYQNNSIEYSTFFMKQQQLSVTTAQQHVSQNYFFQSITETCIALIKQ